MTALRRHLPYLLALLLAAWSFIGASSVTAQENGTTVYEEDFAEDPNYTIAISENIQDKAEVYWDEGEENFYAKIKGTGTPLFAVGMSPTFTTVQPEDGFSTSFQFNPVSYTTGNFDGSSRAPGVYLVEDGDTENPQEKTRALEFTAPYKDGRGVRFRLLSASGDEFTTPVIPSTDEPYEVSVTYHPASQTVDIEILRQDGSVLVDQRNMSMEITNPFDQVLIGEISDDDFKSAEIRVDDFQVETHAPYPSPPEQLTGSASNQQVFLSWLGSTSDDVAGYNVYRSIQPFDEIDDATKVNGSLVSSPGFTDTGLNNGTTYYYRTTTVDTDGNESELSSEITAAPVENGTVVYKEDFDDNPEYTVVYTPKNVQINSRASWDKGPDNFYTKIKGQETPLYAVGMSPTFATVQPEDGFSISFRFNPVSYTTGNFGGSSRAPGVYLVEDGDTENPQEKTRALEFTAPYKDGNGVQFRLLSAGGDEYVTPVVPTEDERYEVNLTYNPAGQTVNIEILRQDGSVFVDQQAVSMEITNPFDQVLIGEISDNAFKSADIRVDDIEVQTNSPYPAPPEELTASASNQQAVLMWLPSASNDVVGYNVYRSIQPFDEISDATKVNGTLLNSPGFTNTGLSNGTTYYYRTTTVDSDGNESNPSAEVTTTPLVDGTVMYSENFADRPSLTVDYTGNVIEKSRVTWEKGPGNFYAKVNADDAPFFAVGKSPIFSMIWPEDGFITSFRFNPVSYGGSARTPGVYFVESGDTDNPQEKTRALEFTGYKDGGGVQFRLLSASGDEFITPVIPSMDEQYEVSLTYNPESQTVIIEIFRQDGSVFLDQQAVSMEITNPFDQVLLGEISDEDGGTAVIRIDEIEIRSEAAPPVPPSDLSAQASYEQVTLTWADTTDPDLEAYWVYRGTTAEFDTTGSRVAVLSQNNNQYEDTNVINGTTYFYRVLATNESGFVGELSSTVSATPGENLVASVSETVSSDGNVDFGVTGVDVVFSGVGGSGTVTVEKFGDSPENIEGISESDVSSYRHVISADGDLSFGSDTEVRLDVSTLGGISDASNVTIYKRPDVGSGMFSELTTSYDENDNELFATTGSFSEFALASNTEPLPVELADFEAARLGSRIRLSWRTASEQNNARFEIQRTTGQSNSWQRVGTREGAGTTTEPQRYQFTDDNLPYEAERFIDRLKQVNTNGTTNLSDAVQIEVGAPDQVELKAPFPNPASSQITVRYAIPEEMGDQPMRLVLYDVLGREVRMFASGKDPGRNEVSHRVAEIPNGTYFLRQTVGETRRTERFTVVR